MNDLVCPNCFSKNIVKDGWHRDKQRYMCKKCSYHTIYPLQADDAEILIQNVKLQKQKQSYQDLNRIERKVYTKCGQLRH